MTDQPQSTSQSLGTIVAKTDSKKLYAELDLPLAFIKQWVTTEADRDFAWQLYTELRTRIATQPLHFMHGKEVVALKSMYELFPFVRTLIHEEGRAARNAVNLSLAMINKVVRPFTAKWDGRINPDIPLREDDGTEFRKELDALQIKIRSFASMLACIAEQDEYVPQTESWPTKVPVKPNKVTIEKGDPEKVDPKNVEPKDVEPENVEPEKSIPIPFAIQFQASVSGDKANEILEAEKKAIIARRQAIDSSYSNESLEDVTGLSISGGGIRSASFALGVVQELSRHDILQHFDYLSTVSGGGYLGSFLSSYLNGPAPNTKEVSAKDVAQDVYIGLGKNQLPLNRPEETKVGEPNQGTHRAQSESAPIRHLRGHSKYLLTGGLLNRLSMIVVSAFGIIANLIILLPIVAAILLSVVAFRPQAIGNLKANPTSLFTELANDESSFWSLVAIPVMIGSLAMVFSIARLSKREEISRCWLNIVSLFVPVAFLFVLWRMLPWSIVQVESLFQSKRQANWFTTIASIATVIMFLQRYWALLNANPSMSKIKRVTSILVLGLFGPIFLFTCLFLVAYFTVLEPFRNYSPLVSLICLTVAPLIFGLLFLDINQSSLHPFYRRKLCEAFVVAKHKSAATVVANDDLKLSKMRTRNQSGPYHLINAALNAPSSDNGVMRERGTDFFLFSQAYTGSASTGYYPTTKWEERDSRLNLGTAMAISGAAASPVMGVVPLPSAKFLLAVFNVRLDFWLAVPDKWTFPILWWTPGPWYLIRQAIGWMDEKSTFVNLSDGGHIENLGLYELLRRRCRHIVVIDGECDPKLECGALMQAARFAKLDFGVEVDIDMNRFQTKQDGAAKYHFSFGKILYPKVAPNDTSNMEGRILYIKLSRTGNEPAGVEHYRLRNPDFPHQSTADQFFDEAQFEAYRCLGEHIADDIFKMVELDPNNTSSTRLAEWFQKLEDKLTDPMVG